MKYLLPLFFLLFGLIATPVYAATIPVPSAHCLSSNPCTTNGPSSTVLSPTSGGSGTTSGQPSSAPSSAVTTTQTNPSSAPSTNPSPSSTPCSTSGASVASQSTGTVSAMSWHHHGKWHSSGNQGFLQQLIQWLWQFLQQLFQKLGIQLPGLPCGTTSSPSSTPSSAPSSGAGGGSGGSSPSGTPSSAPGNTTPTIFGTSPAPTSAPSASGSAAPVIHLGIWISAEDSGSFSTIAGQKPDVANDYLAWDASWPSQFVTSAEAAGATPFIELEPWHMGSSNGTPLFSDITSGTYDTWLTSIGTSVKSLGKPVIFTFAHEFNVSGQYPWAEGDTGSCGSSSCTPAQWIQAWDHVESVIDKAAGQNAYFMWGPNVDSGGSNTNPVAWWPGASEVQMVGVDGYPAFINSSGGTFQSDFGQTFSEIHTVTKLPIFISETDLSPLGSGGYESITNFIQDLFADGGDGILEFEDGTPAMTSAQWTELDAALAKYPN